MVLVIIEVPNSSVFCMMSSSLVPPVCVGVCVGVCGVHVIMCVCLFVCGGVGCVWCACDHVCV